MGAIQSYGVEVQRVPRAEHASDILPHPVGELELKEGLQRMPYNSPDECVDHPWLRCSVGQSSAATES